MFFVKIKTCLLTAVQPGSPVLSSVWEGRRGEGLPRAQRAPGGAGPGSGLRGPTCASPLDPLPLEASKATGKYAA